MARFGRSVPLMQRPRPLRQLVIADDFTNLNAWTGRAGAPATTTTEFFSNGAVSPGWCAMQHNSRLDSDDFDFEWTIGFMTGTVNGNEDVSGFSMCDTSGNGIVGETSTGNSFIWATSSWNPGAWVQKATGSFVGWTAGDRCGFRRIGNVYQMYKNRSPTSMASWIDTGNTIPIGINYRQPAAHAYNNNAGQARQIADFRARSLISRAA